MEKKEIAKKADESINWLRRAIAFAVLLFVGIALLKFAGITSAMLPKVPHETLAYLAGAYWLTK